MALSTDVAQMEASAGHVENVKDSIVGRMNTLMGRVEGSTGFWAGGSSKAFQDLMVRYKDAQGRLQETLAEIAGNIRKSGVGYDEAEQANQSSLSQAGSSSLFMG